MRVVGLSTGYQQAINRLSTAYPQTVGKLSTAGRYQRGKPSTAGRCRRCILGTARRCRRVVASTAGRYQSGAASTAGGYRQSRTALPQPRATAHRLPCTPPHTYIIHLLLYFKCFYIFNALLRHSKVIPARVSRGTLASQYQRQ